MFYGVTLSVSIWRTEECDDDLDTDRGSNLELGLFSFLFRIGMDTLFIVCGAMIAFNAYDNMAAGNVPSGKHVRVELTTWVTREYSTLLPFAGICVMSVFFLNSIFKSQFHAQSTQLLPLAAAVQAALVLPMLIALAEIAAAAKFVRLRSLSSFALRILGVKRAVSIARKVFRYSGARRLAYAVLRRIKSRSGRVPVELVLGLQFFVAAYVTQQIQEHSSLGDCQASIDVYSRFPISAFLAGAVLGKCVFEELEVDHGGADVLVLVEGAIVLLATWLEMYSVAAVQILVATLLFVSTRQNGRIGQAVSSSIRVLHCHVLSKLRSSGK